MLLIYMYHIMHIYVSFYLQHCPKSENHQRRKRKPPKERAVPVPSSTKETDKSTLGLHPSTAVVKTLLEATQNVPVPVYSLHETSCCRQDSTDHSDDVVPLSPNVSSADLREENVELEEAAC